MKKFIKKINIADPSFSLEDKKIIHDEIDNILVSKLSMGSNVTNFEKEFTKKISAKHSIAMNSCTAALEAALTYYDVKDKEVIIPSQTFIATGMAVHLSGGIPVFAEINKNDLCLDIEDVKNKITDKTSGIIIVHMAGHISSEILVLKEYCDQNNLFLIEDAAHTPGAEINGIKAGNIGHIGCFSFYPTKIITSGEGGMLTTSDDSIAAYARSYQNRGNDMNSDNESYIIPSRNVRLTEFAALLGRVQLSHLDEYLNKRKVVAKIYQKRLKNIEGLDLILPNDLKQSSCWKVPVILDTNSERNRVMHELHLKGIFVDKAYNPPLHLQPVMVNLYQNIKNMLPISEDLLKRHICLPSHQNMSEYDAEYVCNNLIKILRRK